mmetsp:Transcript_38169/g.75095  ORF Transcript_38169/g.75095 Transcript_38169/m.75095 type:complete len:972 (-) Transcript_38169:45-2960(-)|eukprot:CAMPEP_0175131218 /NCGR_PEP_ID=MMETSP0087-20121206/6422_1 /TAXON_ID=136419 /ORGANISM="Unknown Unknown, Strain D1" /LENGTH=971 /DNA_ID=CAMNT_0016413487 /DNA_START=43 /DNA_END=2958 /DNA_ORIENTATION=-
MDQMADEKSSLSYKNLDEDSTVSVDHLIHIESPHETLREGVGTEESKDTFGDSEKETETETKEPETIFRVNVSVLKATELKATLLQMNAYVKLHLDDNPHKEKTCVAEPGSSPIWVETFSFVSTNPKLLHVVVKDKQTVGHTLVGKLVVPLDNLFGKVPEPQTFELTEETEARGFVELLIEVKPLQVVCLPGWTFYRQQLSSLAPKWEVDERFLGNKEALKWEAEHRAGCIAFSTTGMFWDIPDTGVLQYVENRSMDPEDGIYVKTEYEARHKAGNGALMGTQKEQSRTAINAADHLRAKQYGKDCFPDDQEKSEQFYLYMEQLVHEQFSDDDNQLLQFFSFLDQDFSGNLDSEEVKTGLFMLLRNAFAGEKQLKPGPDVVLASSLPSISPSQSQSGVDRQLFNKSLRRTIVCFHQNLVKANKKYRPHSRQMVKDIQNYKKYLKRIGKSFKQGVSLTQSTSRQIKKKRVCGIAQDVCKVAFVVAFLPFLFMYWRVQKWSETAFTDRLRGWKRTLKRVALACLFPVGALIYYFPWVTLGYYIEESRKSYPAGCKGSKPSAGCPAVLQISFMEVVVPVVCTVMLLFVYGLDNIYHIQADKRKLEVLFTAAQLSLKENSVDLRFFNPYVNVDKTENLNSHKFLTANNSFPRFRMLLISFLMAVLHCSLPGFYRVANGTGAFFGGSASLDILVSLNNLLVSLPAVTAVLYLLHEAVSEYSNLHRSVTRVTSLMSSHAAYHYGLPFYLEMHDSTEIDFWLMLRNYSKQKVNEKVKAFIAPALVVDTFLVITLVYRLLSSSSEFGELDLICMYDAGVTSCLLVAFLAAVVKVNYQMTVSHVEMLERLKYNLAIEIATLIPAIDNKVGKSTANIAQTFEKSVRPRNLSVVQQGIRRGSFIVQAEPLHLKERNEVSSKDLERLQALSVVLESAVYRIKNVDQPVKVFGLVVDHHFLIKILVLLGSGAASGLLQFMGLNQ